MEKKISSEKKTISPEEKKIYLKAIRDYVSAQKKAHQPMGTRQEMYHVIEAKMGKKFHRKKVIALITFYTYLQELAYYKHSDYNYGFNDQTVNLHELVGLRNYDQHLCFAVKDDLFAPIICAKVNDYFQDYDYYLHCVYFQSLIVCFYDSEKITRAEVQTAIPEFLKGFTLEDYATDRRSFLSEKTLADLEEQSADEEEDYTDEEEFTD